MILLIGLILGPAVLESFGGPLSDALTGAVVAGMAICR